MGQKDSVRDTLFGVYNGGTKPGMRCVRKGDWKLIKYDVMEGKVRETQLFNLAVNPNEFIDEHGKNDGRLKDLAEDPAYKDKLEEMEGVLLAEMRRLDDPYRLWNQPDDGLEPPVIKKKRAGRKKKKPVAK